jgi:hypothetical protein
LDLVFSILAEGAMKEAMKKVKGSGLPVGDEGT